MCIFITHTHTHTHTHIRMLYNSADDLKSDHNS